VYLLSTKPTTCFRCPQTICSALTKQRCSRMDLDVIETIFRFGKIFALTPSSIYSRECGQCQKIYICFLFLFYTCGAILTFIYKMSLLLSTFTTIQLALRIVMDVDLYLSITFCLMVVTLTKQNRWYQLINNLKEVRCETYSRSLRYVPFYTILLMFWIAAIFTICVWIGTLGWSFLQAYTIECLQIYYQFYSVLVANMVLRMLLRRYHQQKALLRSHPDPTKQLFILARVKRNLFILKHTVAIFNEIFGWTLLLSVIFGVSRSLVYLDLSIKDSTVRSNTSEFIPLLISRLSIIVLFWVRPINAKISLSVFN
jgi:hypothetical protein